MTEPVPDAETTAEAVLQSLLVDLGIPAPEVERATEEGTLHLLALERLVSLEAPAYTLEEVADRIDIDAADIRAYWRALGFPEPRPGEPIFSDTDLEMLASVVPFITDGGLPPATTIQMARVIGSSLARIAAAQIEAIQRALIESAESAGSDDADESSPAGVDLIDGAQRAAELLPMMPQLMEMVWRRHLGTAARRQIVRAATDDESEDVCVGFADLVGFTAQTQELPEDELVAVVDRFESIAYDRVAAHGGRVVKMIGDEVMFVTDSVRTGAELALDLAQAYRDDEDLSDVRVGLSAGQVLERDGDVYGPVVNRASRIVAIAYPGSVVVGPDVAAALEDDEAFVFRSIRTHYLKDIGRIRLFTMRATGDESELPHSAERSRRKARRQFILDRRLLRMRDAPVDEILDVEESEYDDLADAVLDAELDEETQVELLADIETARRLDDLESQALQLAEEADEKAERRIDEIDEETRQRVEELELEKRRQVSALLEDAEGKANRVNEQASRRVRKVAEEAERRADRAERDARREAKRIAQRAKNKRKRQEAEADADGEAETDDGD